MTARMLPKVVEVSQSLVKHVPSGHARPSVITAGQQKNLTKTSLTTTLFVKEI